MIYKIYSGVDYKGTKRVDGFTIEYDENVYAETNSKEKAKEIFDKLSAKCIENCKKNKRYCYYTYVTESYPKDYTRTILAHRYQYNMQVNEVRCNEKITGWEEDVR